MVATRSQEKEKKFSSLTNLITALGLMGDNRKNNAFFHGPFIETLKLLCKIMVIAKGKAATKPNTWLYIKDYRSLRK